MRAAGCGNVRPRLVIMVKEPVIGRVKTRLAKGCSSVRATQFMRTNLTVTLRRLGRDPRWHTILAIAPDRAMASTMFPHELARMPQGHGNIGTRMGTIAAKAPAGPLIIIGADIPAIRARDIADAFSALRSADAVFGRTGDGGYWLVGLSPRLRRTPPFANVRWSSPHALQDTIANLSTRTVAFAAHKDDVDEVHDLARLGAYAQRLIV